MNPIQQPNGLSARRRPIDNGVKFISNVSHLIKRGTVWGILAGALLISSCHEKSNGQNATGSKKDHSSVIQDSLNKPDVNIKVNRRYDDKGNLIGFDSTYSSFYSNVKVDTAGMDTLMHRFDRFFNRHHSTIFDQQFNSLFFTDSLRYPDFFHNDFFLKRYELNDDYFRSMMHRMDSIKNRFYQEQRSKGKDSKEL
jgi:hypothetical protein